MESKDIQTDRSVVRFGVVADLQYYDGPHFKNRYFIASKEKLESAIHTFNSTALDFVVNLGDTIDRDWNSFQEILPVFDRIDAKTYHVLGNHDFEVEENRYREVSHLLGMPEYYSFTVSNWRFIVLNGNQISTFSNAEISDEYKQAEAWLEEMEKKELINAQFYNGGIGEDQLHWLDAQLKDARKKEQQVIIFCHYPVFPANKHNLLNADQVLELVQKSDAVKAWFCGHNHKGNYGQSGNIHFVTMKGMVEGEVETAFAIVTLSDRFISIKGFGNEVSARLSFEPLHR